MMARRQRAGQVVPVTPRDATRYLEIAGEWLRAAEGCYERGDYHAACGISVNAGIQAGDAVSAFLTGTRWAGSEHAQALQHVESAGPDGKDIAKHLRKLLPNKTLYQYDPAEPAPKEASDVLLAAKRAVAIAERVGKRHLEKNS